MRRKQVLGTALLSIMIASVMVYGAEEMSDEDIAMHDVAPLQPTVSKGSLKPELKRLLAKSNFVTIPQYLKLLHQLNTMLQRVTKLRKTKQDKAVRIKVKHLLSSLKDKQKKYTLTIKHYKIIQDKANQLSNQIEEMITTQKMQKDTSYSRVATVLGF